jgi:hypothetical protein
VKSDLINSVVAISVDVAVAVLPLVAVFLVFQFAILKLPARQVADVLTGTAIAALGLFLFLWGIAVGFLPFGRAVGAALAALTQSWTFVAVGMLLGFVTAWGEPAVRVLADQVEGASSGSIPSRMVLYAICVGVAVWVGLGVFRIVSGAPLLSLLVPGYLGAIVLMWLSDRDFVSIAADAGGVATGPLANSFLLAFALGASGATGGQMSVVQGFGLVALIALAPILSVMALGMLIRFKTPDKE